jgi:L-amino acid N-acyltransferase YncA
VNLGDWLRGDARPDQLPADYPAHIHINLSKDARGHGAGEQLLDNFIRQSQAAGIRGIHANVSEGNAGGRHFFEHSGFTVLGRENRFRFPDAPDQQTFTIIYGKKLSHAVKSDHDG